MFNLDRLKHLAEQAVVLASGAVQQAENAIDGAVRATDTENDGSDLASFPEVPEQKGTQKETENPDLLVDSQPEEPLAIKVQQQDDNTLPLPTPDESNAQQQEPKSTDLLRAEKAEALAKKLGQAFKTQKAQLEKQAAALEKLTLDCGRLAEEKRAVETSFQEHKEASTMLLAEKDKQITELLREGETLSKKHGMLLDSVRRLRKEITDRDKDIEELKSHKAGKATFDPQSSGDVLALLGLVQQQQASFYSHSQRQLEQILTAVSTANSSTTKAAATTEEDATAIAPATDTTTAAATGGSSLDHGNASSAEVAAAADQSVSTLPPAEDLLTATGDSAISNARDDLTTPAPNDSIASADFTSSPPDPISSPSPIDTAASSNASNNNNNNNDNNDNNDSSDGFVPADPVGLVPVEAATSLELDDMDDEMYNMASLQS